MALGYIECCGLLLSDAEFEEFCSWALECCGMRIPDMMAAGRDTVVVSAWVQYQDELFSIAEQ